MTEDLPRLSLVVHFHQPVGNLDRVVRHASRRCYLPFLRVLEAHPEIPWTLHYSGCLLRWLEANEPEVTRRLGRLVDSGVVELMTGGMEEPILVSIPQRDQLAQIQRMSDMLRDRFGVGPSGLWLTERVWEPNLPSTLKRSGVTHTVIDDTSLRAVGVPDGREAGPWVTDFEGDQVLLLGASRRLRYLIPYGGPEAVIQEVERTGGLSVYADDGEKFGEWPDTYDQVYRRRWLHRFLTGLERASGEGRLEVVRLSVAAKAQPRGRVYLPSCSYDEMMTWALPTPARVELEASLAEMGQEGEDGLRQFVRGAPWQGFLAKYPEVARLHRAMLRISAKVDRAGAPRAAVEHLHKAQCNCAYWHGTFGGAYLSFLRLELWRQLGLAEQAADLELGTSPRSGVDILDPDAGGKEEVRLWGQWGHACVAPGLGGQVVELVSRGGGANLAAVMSRHQEAYHLRSPAAAEQNSELEMGVSAAPSSPWFDHLTFDPGEVGALRDWLDGSALDQPYDWEPTQKGVRLSWVGAGVRLDKAISATSDGLMVDYQITPTGARWHGVFGVEVRSCPTAPGRTADQVRVRAGRAGWVVGQPGAVASLRIEATPPQEPEVAEIVAIGATLQGWERMQQGTSLTWNWTLDATAEQPAEVRMLLTPLAASRQSQRPPY